MVRVCMMGDCLPGRRTFDGKLKGLTPYGVSCLLVCEKLDSSASWADEGVEMEETLSELGPVSEKKMSCSTTSASSKWNISHVCHLDVT